MNKQDEDKAKEIGKKFYFVGMNSNEAAYKAALQMAAWKEQQMIERAVSILRDEIQYHDIYEERDIETFKKRMMEENQ